MTEQSINTTDDISAAIRTALDLDDQPALVALIAPLSLSSALRELLDLPVEERAHLLSVLPSDMSTALIEEAPSAAGADLMDLLAMDLSRFRSAPITHLCGLSFES